MGDKMIWMDLEETNRSAHWVTGNSRGPRIKPCEYWWQKTRDKVLVLLTQERVYHYFFRRGCSKGDKKMKLSCSFKSVTKWSNDKAEHLPVPFDITPFSSTPTIAAGPHKRDWIPFAICTSPVTHLVLKIHNPSPFLTQNNVERSKKLCLDGFNTVRGVGTCSANSPRI